MKHIRLFEELFDSEELKAENEVDYLSDKIKPRILTSDIVFQDPNIQKIYIFLQKNFPFMDAFFKNNGKVGVRENPEEVIHFFVTDDVWILFLSFKPLLNGNIDMAMLIKTIGSVPSDDEKKLDFDTFNLTKDSCAHIYLLQDVPLKDVVDPIRKIYIPMIKKAKLFKSLTVVPGIEPPHKFTSN